MRLQSLWRNLFRRERVARELDEELQSAFDLLIEEKTRSGRRAGALVDELLQDGRHAIRVFRRSPLFTLTAAASVAIGIAANTTIFTVANALLLRAPAGVADHRRLVDIGAGRNGEGFKPGSYLDYLDIRQRTTTLDGVYATGLFGETLALWTGPSARAIERAVGEFVTPNFFSVLGARPAAGRFFTEADGEAPGGTALVVLSHDFWTRRFNRDPHVIGSTIGLNGRPFTIVGVAAERFQGTRIFAGDVWMPINMIAVTRGDPSILTARGAGWLMIGGRLRRGVSIGRASAEVDAIARLLERDHPESNRGKQLRVRRSSLLPGADLPVAIFLGFLLGTVGLVLLIACANLAGVLLARGA